jgi:hypothetical protein
MKDKLFTFEEVVDFVLVERMRCVRVAKSFMNDNLKRATTRRKSGDDLAFIDDKVAEECRLIANQLEKKNAIGQVLGHTAKQIFIDELLRA